MKITYIKLRDIATCDSIAQIVDPTADIVERLWCLPARMFGEMCEVKELNMTQFEVYDPDNAEITWFVPLCFVQLILYDE